MLIYFLDGMEREVEIGPKADLRGADLQGAYLPRVNLRGANLQGANLLRANLQFADLRGANLRRAKFQDANLQGTELGRANLRGANLQGASLSGADFSEAILDVPIPTIPDLHKAIYAAVTSEGNGLNMSDWHTCGTTHCRAGWIVTLAGEPGRKLEELVGTEQAALLIADASDSPISREKFYDTDEDAMADIERCAGVTVR